MTSAQSRPEIGYVNGGYQNETFPDAFVNYAKIVMSHYADRVPVWYTYNEPLLYSQNGQSIYNVIKSHAQVYHFYKKELKGTGKVALKFNNNFGVPRNPESEVDVYAADHFNTFRYVWNQIRYYSHQTLTNAFAVCLTLSKILAL